MAIKKGIDVPVDDGAFQESLSAFAKFAEAARKAPSEWAQLGFQIKAVQKTADEVTNQYTRQSQQMSNGLFAHLGFSSAAQRAGSIFSSLARDSRSIAENLARGASSLLSIATITGAVGGLLGFAGGLFGADEMSRLVAARRRTALGLGVSYGQLSSFGINFGRYGDAEAILGGVSSSLYDYTSPGYTALLAAGVNGGGNAADKAYQLMQNLPGLFQGVPDEQIGPRAESLGLTEIMSVKEIIAYLHSSEGERQTQARKYKSDAQTLELSRQSQQAWSHLSTTLSRAGISIETVLADKLSSLAQPIEKLSESVVKIINAFSGTDIIENVLNKINDGLIWFSDRIGSKEFQYDARHFLDGLKNLAPVVKKVIELAKFGGRLIWYGGKLIADPNYNPTWSGLAKDLLGSSPDTFANPGVTTGKDKYPMLRARSVKPRINSTGTHGNDETPTPGWKAWWENSTGSSAPTTGLGPIESPTIQGLAERLQKVYPDFTTGQCVELAFKMSGIPYTNEMVRSVTRGPSAASGELPPGTPVSTFFNEDRTIGEHYAAGGTGTAGIGRDHMGILVDSSKGSGFNLLEQYAGSRPHTSTYTVGDRPGTEHDAGAYFAVMDSMGLPAGTYENNPYRRQVLAKIAADRFSGGAQAISEYNQSHKQNVGQQSYLDHFNGTKDPKSVIVMDLTNGNSVLNVNREAYG